MSTWASNFSWFLPVRGDSRDPGVITRVEGILRTPERPADLEYLALAAGAAERAGFDVAFQMVRGPRLRREIELMTDYAGKLMTEGHLNDDDLDQLEIYPHQNEHIDIMMKSIQPIFACLYDRPAMFLSVAQPRLIIGDEPILVNTDDSIQSHAATCTDPWRTSPDGNSVHRAVHVRSTQHRGIQTVEEIVVPITPRTALIYGPRGQRHEGPVHLAVTGQDENDLVDFVQARAMSGALEWIAARPDNPDFRTLSIPPPGPLLKVCDGDSRAGRPMRQAPKRRRPRRLDRHVEANRAD